MKGYDAFGAYANQMLVTFWEIPVEQFWIALQGI